MSAVVPTTRKFADLLGAVEPGAPLPHDRRPIIQDLDQVGVGVISRERVDFGAAGT
jgi:hypothetical protein